MPHHHTDPDSRYTNEGPVDPSLLLRHDGKPFANLVPRRRENHRLGSPYVRARDLEGGDIIELGDGRHVTIVTRAYSFHDMSVHLEILGDDGMRAEYQLRYMGTDPVKVVYTPHARMLD